MTIYPPIIIGVTTTQTLDDVWQRIRLTHQASRGDYHSTVRDRFDKILEEAKAQRLIDDHFVTFDVDTDSFLVAVKKMTGTWAIREYCCKFRTLDINAL